MPTLGAPLDFAKLEGRNLRAHQLGSAPSSPVGGQIYYDTGTNTLFWYDANLTTWITARGGGAPAAHATSHQPGGSDPMAVDAAAGTGSLRTLSTTGTSACAGNDSRLSDSRAPTGAAGGDLTGSTYPNPVVAALAITDAKVATANKDGAAGTVGMRTLAYTGNAAMPGIARLDQIAAPTSSVNLNNQKITSLLDPVSSADAATKGYVDTFAQGLDSHPSVRAATTANITLSGTQTVDGIALVALDRCLVKDQTIQSNNGIYVVNAGAWTRAGDQDSWTEVPSAYVWVELGTVNADTGWVCTADQGGLLGTTNITWTQFTGAALITAGTGLTKTGNTIDAVGTSNRITVAADSIDISTSYVGQATITTLGTVTTGTWNAGQMAIAYGGTSASSATTARAALGVPTYYTSATHGAGTTITIAQTTHGMVANRAIMVQVQVEATGAVILPDVAVASNGDVTVTFSVSQSANTIRVTLCGLQSTGQPV